MVWVRLSPATFGGRIVTIPAAVNTVERLVARARIVLTAAVTWLVVAGTIITIVIDELAAAGVAGAVLRVLAGAVTVIGVAVTIIRRVTPVLPAARGLIGTGAPNTDLEAIGADYIRDAIAAGDVVEQYPGEFA
jgi:hypothetical protein